MNHYVHYLSHDAPSIATADMGIAMGVVGTDTQTLSKWPITCKLPYVLNLAKATVRNMKQNMFLAVGTVFILLAGVLTKNINLASGMLVHELSVLLVIPNAIRLVWYRPRFVSGLRDRLQAINSREKLAVAVSGKR